MRRSLALALVVQAGLVCLVAVALVLGKMPLGIPGEWEWLRLPVSPEGIGVLLAAGAVAAYAAVAGVGSKLLGPEPAPLREACAVAVLTGAAVTVQALVPVGAPAGYGLEKWGLVLPSRASCGYFHVAKHEVRDPWRFLADYPDWIRRQDALHIGTHPPGLILIERALLGWMRQSPGLARATVDALPAPVVLGFRTFDSIEPLSESERAALSWTGALTLVACATTVIPLYLLARAGLSASAAWAAAALWPLAPSAILFHPVADTAFPWLSTAALALAVHAAARRGPSAHALGALAGFFLAIGMQLTLAFLAVGLIVGLAVIGDRSRTPAWRVGVVLAVGAGFLAATFFIWALSGANPFAIWWWNQRNHARFYQEFHRSYLAWLGVNPIELALALGIPSAVWAIVGLLDRREAPRVAWATVAVLALLTLSGRNLSEVARLWLPFLPPLLVAAGHGLARFGGGPKTVAASVALLGAQTLAFQAAIQVVYPT